MPWRARLSLPSIPRHLIQCGNHRAVGFYTEEGSQFYLDRLTEQA
jgi:putative transposase